MRNFNDPIFDEASQQALLDKQWPAWAIDRKQYVGMRRWRAAIYWYFMRGFTLKKLAKKMNITFDAAHSLVRNIRRASNGTACRNGRVAVRRPGRPPAI